MKPLLVANWKMHKTRGDALAFVEELRQLWPDEQELEAAIAPPHTALDATGTAVRDLPIELAAQNVHWEEEGAFTGEVSARFLADLGCRYVIVGHSERRTQWHESDAMINHKIAAVLSHGMTPILCLGESLKERDAGRVLEVIGAQLKGALEGISVMAEANPRAPGPRLVLAYEPVWAIGTGRVATPTQVREVHTVLRQWLADLLGGAGASEVRILYGGSVAPDNVAKMIDQPEVNGALVGGASLDAKQFVALAEAVAKAHAAKRSPKATP